MTLGMTRGEILLIASVFGLVYLAGLLPKIARWLGGREEPAAKQNGEEPGG